VGTAHLIELTFMVGDAHPAIMAELALIRRTDYSDDCSPATQRRCRMQQSSPAIFWLLLAATLAVDSVAASWAYMTTLDQAGNVYFGLVCSQISVVCIGSSLSAIRGHGRWIGPLAAPVVAAALTTWLRHDRGDAYQNFLLYLSLWLPQAAILVAILWLLQQSPIAERWGRPNSRGNWRFSVAHLLIIMTACAILLVILRLAEQMHEFWIVLAVWTANNVALAVAALLIYTMRWHGIPRLSAIAGISLVFAVGIESSTQGHPDALSVNLIQTIVLFVWLAAGGIVPGRARFDRGGADLAPS
jgi:hypothetical protein